MISSSSYPSFTYLPIYLFTCCSSMPRTIVSTVLAWQNINISNNNHQNTKDMSFAVHRIKRMLTSTSQLEAYLPLNEEDADDKRQRILNDSAKLSPSQLQGHQLTNILNQHYTPPQLCYHPLANWLIVWYCFVFQAIIFYFTEMTIVLTFRRVAWQSQLSSTVFLLLDVFYILVLVGDIYVQLNAGYITNSAIILSRQRVVNRYTHYYLYLDLLIILVLSSALISGNYFVNWGKVLILFKLIRMFEFNGMMLRKLSTEITARLFYEISKQFVTVYILAQLWGIFFYAMDRALIDHYNCQANNSFCWLYSSTAYSPIYDLPWGLQYFYTLYWGVNTMCQISYGDIAPNNPIQTPYALAGMCFGMMVYSYIVNNVVKAIIMFRKKRDLYRVNLVVFDRYMEKLKLKKEDQYEITNFLKQRFSEERSRNLLLEDLMKSRLPEDMKIELARNAYGHLAQGLDYFMGSERAITRMLFAIKQKKYSENERIIDQGSPVNDLYFMHKGAVKMTCEYNHKHFLITQINMPDTFITAYELFLNLRSPVSVTATTNTIFYFISREEFEKQSLMDIEFKQSYHFLQYDIFVRKQLGRIFYSCYLCKDRHHWYECETLFPSFKKVTLQTDENQELVNRVRVVNRKHRTWTDRHKLRELDGILKRNTDRMLSRLQYRIFSLKKQIRLSKDMLDVDAAYDWTSYLKEENLTKFKEEWNKKRESRPKRRDIHQEESNTD